MIDDSHRIASAALVSVVLLLGVVGCSSTAATTIGRPYIPQYVGLEAVASPPCTAAQLHGLRRAAPATRVRIRSTQPGSANTRKTAIKIKRNTLLAITIQQRGTGHLAVTVGCWIKSESSVRRGVMTVKFMMDQTGYAELVAMEAVPAGADAAARVWYLHVVRS
jgi:hypothetical protein